MNTVYEGGKKIFFLCIQLSVTGASFFFFFLFLSTASVVVLGCCCIALLWRMGQDDRWVGMSRTIGGGHDEGLVVVVVVVEGLPR